MGKKDIENLPATLNKAIKELKLPLLLEDQKEKKGMWFKGLILLVTPRLLFCCGGVWQENMADWRILWNVNTITICDYSNTDVKTPSDARSDTQYIKLIGNSIQNGDLDVPLLYSQLPELLAINLDENLLTVIPDLGLFSSTLTYISINGNNLVSVDFNTFHIFPLLRSLGLGNNNLQTSDLTPNTAETILPWLYTIDLYGNAIAEIQLDFFTYMTHLERLDFSRNPEIKLKEPVPDAITKLHLNRCYGTDGVFNFTMFTHVSTLIIQGNHLTGLQGQPGDAMETIENLDIRDNLLTTLDLQYFNDVAANVVTLQADNNMITEISVPKDVNNILPRLEKLTLTGNPLAFFGYYCSSHFDSLPQGLRLDLANTKLYCGESLLWLATCPYFVTMEASPPVCASPPDLQGKDITEAMAKLLYHSSQKDQTMLYTKRQSPNTNQETLVIVQTRLRQGIIHCARLCSAVQGRSFTYDKILQSCVIYHDNSGEFVMA